MNNLYFDHPGIATVQMATTSSMVGFRLSKSASSGFGHWFARNVVSLDRSSPSSEKQAQNAVMITPSEAGSYIGPAITMVAKCISVAHWSWGLTDPNRFGTGYKYTHKLGNKLRFINVVSGSVLILIIEGNKTKRFPG